MKRNKTIAIIAVALLTSSMMAFWTPNVSATPSYRIVLPFWTGWEEGAGIPIGLTNVVDWKKDFYGAELSVRDSGYMDVPTPPDGTFYGYSFGDRYLVAAGSFETSYSYCYFSLFDTTADSDYQPPIKIKPQTFINIFYYHHQLGDCMIDAELYNLATNQHWTLRDFNHDGEYIVDQNGVRIHPAYRDNDPVGSWQFATFDLSIVYNSYPEYWYITKIWVAFDNGNDHSIGQARTYFDLLHITYGMSGYMPWSGPYGTTDTVSASIIAWEHNPAISGNQLTLKITISGHTTAIDGYCPYTNKISIDHAATALDSPNPTGVNIYDRDEGASEVDEFVMDCAWAILGVLPYGYLFTAGQLAYEFYGLLTTPPGEATYQWPDALTVSWSPSCPTYTLGEVYVLVSELSEGSNTIPITFTTDYYVWNPSPIGVGGWWSWVYSPGFTMNFPFSTEPDELPVSLSISASSGGTTNPAPGTYTYSYGSSVTVTASAYSGYTFDYWILDGATKYGNEITVTMDSDHTLKAYFYYSGGGGGCPILSVYDGTGYVEEGLLDIHNSDGIDVVASHVLIYTPEPVEHRYLLRLTEHEQTYSHIDQVQLFATLKDGAEIKLSLVSAVHSEDGDVLWELRLSDDVRADTLGADHNNGTSEYIDLEFAAPEGLEIEGFTFIIEGHNIVYKV